MSNKFMEKGFTIIEMVISIFILTIAIVGVFTAFMMITILTADAANQLTGTYLAQEGMEIVRNIRDTNWLKLNAGTTTGVTWVDGLNVGACSNDVTGCEADYTSTIMSGNSNQYLYLNSNGFYNYDDTTGTKTNFKRKITIEPVVDVDGSSSHILMVKVQVSWDQKATILNPTCLAGDYGDPTKKCSNGITAEGTLYDWFKYSTPTP